MSIDRSVFDQLEFFAREQGVDDRGPLSVMVTLSRRWQSLQFPIGANDIETPKGGQVKGLGGPNIKSILTEYGIERLLASEGGRTSRGSLELARQYASLLNNLHETGLLSDTADLKEIEEWWVERVREYFARKGFEIQIDASLSVSAMVSGVLEEAYKRQREMRGATIVGTVLEHLIGAKLSLALGEEKIIHKIASTADEASGAPGDFLIEETVIHVTTAPSAALVKKCETNIRNGLRPIIICPTGLKSATMAIASAEGLEKRIEVYEAEEFISMNINEWSGFSASKLMQNSIRLVDAYNRIIDSIEPDKSLRIERKG